VDIEIEDAEECVHGVIPAEFCDECDANGCGFSEEENYTCWMRY
jgi:hypothetical protein